METVPPHRRKTNVWIATHLTMVSSPRHTPAVDALADMGLSARVDPRGWLVVGIDRPGSRANFFGRAFGLALIDLLRDADARTDLRGVLFVSDKKGHFISGGDLKEMRGFSTAEEVRAFARPAQELFSRVAAHRLPTVAAIDGACYGAGLELALACRHRVASSAGHTQFGLPEVRHGFVPGGGGTQRLPRTVGVPRALWMLLGGRPIGAAAALRWGLVDAVLPPEAFAGAALDWADRISRASAPPAHRPRSFALLERAPGVSRLFFGALRLGVSGVARDLESAPRIVDLVEQGLRHGLAAGLEMEGDAYAELAVAPSAKRRIAMFFAERERRKARREPRPVRR